MIREIENCLLVDLLLRPPRSSPQAGTPLFSFDDLQFTGSGKAALSLILRHLHATRVLPDKTHEVLVPEWLGTWVYAQLAHYALPARTRTAKTRALLVYHQYGFPQDLPRLKDYADTHRLTLIEDCAHALAGQDRAGTSLGHWGDYTLFSFSKFIICGALGGVRSRMPGFTDFVADAQAQSSAWVTPFNNTAKWVQHYAADHGGPRWQRWSRQLLCMSYALYDESFRASPRAVQIVRARLDDELAIRRAHYQRCRAVCAPLGLCDHLEADGIYPYVIPLMLPDNKKQPLVDALRAAGYATGMYRFDVRRFALEPDFQPCVWIFCHGGLTTAQFERQLEITQAIMQG